MIRLGFRAKLTFINSLTTLAFAAFFALYVPMQEAKRADAALQARAVSLTTLLAELAAASVVVEEMGGAEALASDLKTAGTAEGELSYVAALRANGSTLARHDAAGADKSTARLTPVDKLTIIRSDGQIHVAVPLRHDGKSVGTLVAGYSRRSVAAARSQGQVSALVVGIIVFAIGLVIAWLISRSVARPLLTAAQSLDSVSLELVSVARQQEASTAEEAAVVTQTRSSMETLLESARRIAEQSSDVLGNAERTAQGSREVASRIDDLNEMSAKVAEFLSAIMQIADKADLLALNASLEGTRAGEAGKGFTLVAAEMRRLAESVMESVEGIRGLMTRMRDASREATESSEQGNESSLATTKSARQIARVTQEQRSATQQVIESMEEMQQVLHLTAEGVRRSAQSAQQISDLAGELSSLVSPTTNRHSGSRGRPRGSDSGRADPHQLGPADRG